MSDGYEETDDASGRSNIDLESGAQADITEQARSNIPGPDTVNPEYGDTDLRFLIKIDRSSNTSMAEIGIILASGEPAEDLAKAHPNDYFVSIENSNIDAAPWNELMDAYEDVKYPSKRSHAASDITCIMGSPLGRATLKQGSSYNDAHFRYFESKKLDTSTLYTFLASREQSRTDLERIVRVPTFFSLAMLHREAKVREPQEVKFTISERQSLHTLSINNPFPFEWWSCLMDVSMSVVGNLSGATKMCFIETVTLTFNRSKSFFANPQETISARLKPP